MYLQKGGWKFFRKVLIWTEMKVSQGDGFHGKQPVNPTSSFGGQCMCGAKVVVQACENWLRNYSSVLNWEVLPSLSLGPIILLALQCLHTGFMILDWLYHVAAQERERERSTKATNS